MKDFADKKVVDSLETSRQITSRQITPHSPFDALSDSAFIREAQLVQSPKRPGYPAPLPFSAPTLWRKVKNGTFPAPHKLSDRVTAWKISDIRAWMSTQTQA